MSARAAWRLEQLGFTDVYDYVPSKIDWFANGLPREGKAARTPWAGDLARSDIPTCEPGERLADAGERVRTSGYDFCVVLNEHRIALGLLRGDALAKDPDGRARDVMELGPGTVRPNTPIERLLQAHANQGTKTWIVTTSHGVLLGMLLRADAELCARKESKRSSGLARRYNATIAWLHRPHPHLHRMDLSADPGQVLMIWTAGPGAKSTQALSLLGSWAATPQQPELHDALGHS